MNELEETDLRVWKVQFSIRKERGYFRNRNVDIAAPNITQAIRGAKLIISEDEDIREYWIVSAVHRGHVHGIVRSGEDE